MGVDLIRVFRIGPVRVNEGSAAVLDQTSGQQMLDQFFDARLAEMQEVPGQVKREPLLFK
jgi:hypothetical protein